MGLIKGTVKLENDYEKFVKEYVEEKKILEKIFKDDNIVIEHMGSTSVKGLKAKPIIDIAIGVNKFKDFEYYNNLFKNSSEYEVRNSLDKDEILIVKGNKEYTSVLIHLMQISDARYKESIIFRDYLRNNEEALKEYQTLKENLALKYAGDRVSYTKSKNDFIKNILKEATKIKLSDLVLKELNVDEYTKFYNNVKDNMKNPNWLGSFTEEMINDVISNGGKIFNYYLDKELVSSVMYINPKQKEMDTFKLDYDYKIVGECGPIMVNPKYIGNGLQNQMLKEFEKFNKLNNKKYIITTVHPDNIHSINNFIKMGYNMNNTFEFKRGKRNLYIKEI